MHPSRCSPSVVVALALLCTASLALSTASAQVPDSELPVIDAPVTDLSGVLTTEAMSTLAAEIVRHREATGVQLAVLLVDTTQGEPIEDYALRVATRWRGGTAARSEGALYVLAVADRRQRLEVGYGLEDRIPDYTAARILEEAIPHLRRQSYQGAVEAVVRAVVLYTGDMAPVPDGPSEDARAVLTAFMAVPVYAAILLVGTFVGSLRRRMQAAAQSEEVALGVGSSAHQHSMLWMALYVLVTGTGAGLLGLGWFHYLGALVGLLAGWRFAWDKVFLTLHYLFMVSVFGVVATSVAGGFSGELSVGIVVGFVAQLLVTWMYSSGPGAGHTRFSSSGVRDEGQEFHDLLRSTPRRADPLGSAWSGSSSRAAGSSWSSSSSSGFSSSSSSSSRSSSSSSRSSRSSSRSSGYSGGGGGFGGGGASSSW